MKRNMTATVMALAMSTVMTSAVLSGCGGTPKETAPETAKEQKRRSGPRILLGKAEGTKKAAPKQHQAAMRIRRLDLWG